MDREWSTVVILNSALAFELQSDKGTQRARRRPTPSAAPAG